MFEFAEMRRISAYARERSIRLHLDGARMFNLPQHSGHGVAEYAALFDTVYVSLYKHFNATAGAIVAGEQSVIEGMARVRRMFGGALPHAWPNIALVTHFLDGYLECYARAWKVADSFIEEAVKDRRLKIDKVPDGTSRFLLTANGVAKEDFAERLLQRNVLLPAARAGAGDAVFPLQVNATLLRTSGAALARLFTESLQA
jgi:threonine aldolase